MMSLLSITGTFYSLAIWICSGIYKVTAYAFKIFLILSRGNLLSSDSYQQLIENFYAVLGVVMLFAIAFALLRGMINPDDQKQGTSTVKKIIVNLVTSVAILAILPTVFGFLYDVQDAVINYNTIGTFFGYGSLNQNGPQYTGPTTNPEQISDEEYSANQIVNGVWKAFFSVDPDWCDGEVEKNNPEINTDSPTARMEWCQEHIQAEEPFNLPQGDLLTYAANSNYVDLTASFGVYGGFAENASEGQIEFLWFLSLVGGVFLLYIAISYCFDMGIRLVKLVFYQVLAPIPIFMRIVPYGKISSTFNQWLKITLTCYLEVFVRIFIFYFVIYICTTIKNSEVLSLTLDNFGFFTKMFTYAFLYMGIFAFMKKSPKLLSEITGIDSGNMKLGLKEKFAEGGGFIATGALGTAGTVLGKKAVNAWKKTSEELKNTQGGFLKKAGVVMKGVGGGLMSGVAGAGSGLVRGGWASRNSKSSKDTGSAINAASNATMEKGRRRADYWARHNNDLLDVVSGHVMDTVHGVGAYFGAGASQSQLAFYSTASSEADSINSASKGTYEGKKVYQDQEAVVKALKAETREYGKNKEREKELNEKLRNAGSLTQQEQAELLNIHQNMTQLLAQNPNLDSLYKQLSIEEQKLETIRLDASEKKADILATAATRLGDNQKKNYVNDKELVKAFNDALTSKFEIQIDAQGNITRTDGTAVDEKTLKIINALQRGEVVDTDWINRDNIIQLQDFIDEVSVKRHNVQGAKEREYIVSNQGGQGSGDKGNSSK